MYMHAEEFKCLGFNMFTPKKNINYVFNWDVEVRKRPNNDDYSTFISMYMAIAYEIIHVTPPPRIFPKQKELL